MLIYSGIEMRVVVVVDAWYMGNFALEEVALFESPRGYKDRRWLIVPLSDAKILRLQLLIC